MDASPQVDHSNSEQLVSAQRIKIKVRSLFRQPRVLTFPSPLSFGTLKSAIQSKFDLDESNTTNFTLWYRDNECEDLQIIDQSDLDACIDEALMLQGLNKPVDGCVRVAAYLLAAGQSIRSVLEQIGDIVVDDSFASCAESINSLHEGFVEIESPDQSDDARKFNDRAFSMADPKDELEDWGDFNTAPPMFVQQASQHNCQEVFEQMMFEFLTSSDQGSLLERYPKFGALMQEASESQRDQIARMIPAFKKEAPSIPIQKPEVVEPVLKPRVVEQPTPAQPKSMRPRPEQKRHAQPDPQGVNGFDIIKGIFDGVSTAIGALGSIEFACSQKQ